MSLRETLSHSCSAPTPQARPIQRRAGGSLVGPLAGLGTCATRYDNPYSERHVIASCREMGNPGETPNMSNSDGGRYSFRYNSIHLTVSRDTRQRDTPARPDLARRINIGWKYYGGLIYELDPTSKLIE